MQCVTVLGSTGTIGHNALDVLARHPDRFSVHALTAYSNATGLLKQCQQHNPKVAVLVDEVAAEQFKQLARKNRLTISVLQGEEGLAQVSSAEGVDTVMAGIVGAAGLLPTLAAVRAGKRVLVLERRHLVGGAAVTEELYPGFKYSVCSYVVSLLRPEIVRDLNLKQPIYKRTAAYGHFGRDGFPWEELNRLDDMKAALGL